MQGCGWVSIGVWKGCSPPCSAPPHTRAQSTDALDSFTPSVIAHLPATSQCGTFIPTSLIKHTSIHAYNASEHLCTLPKTPPRVLSHTCLPCGGFVTAVFAVLAVTGIIVIAFTSQMSFPRMFDLASV